MLQVSEFSEKCNAIQAWGFDSSKKLVSVRFFLSKNQNSVVRFGSPIIAAVGSIVGEASSSQFQRSQKGRAIF